MSKSLSRNDPNYWDEMKKIGVKAINSTKRGRPKAIPSPAKLWEYACEYFAEVDETPIQKEDFIKGGENAGNKVKLNMRRPYTWAGLDRYLFSRGIVAHMEDYRHNARGAYENFSGVVKSIGRIMYEQKFDGASVGIFNQSIIAHDLGFNKEDDKLDRELTVTIVRKSKNDLLDDADENRSDG